MFAAILLTGCSDNNEGEDSMDIPPGYMYVRFVSPVGTNVLDSLGVTDLENPTYTPVPDEGILSVEVFKENSGISIKKGYYAEYRVESPTRDIGNIIGADTPETLLYVHWTDSDLSEPSTYDYDDAYIVKLKSQAIFQDNEDHFVKWFVHIYKGKRYYYVYKCEVDGVDHPLEDDVIWQYKDKLRIRNWAGKMDPLPPMWMVEGLIDIEV